MIKTFDVLDTGMSILATLNLNRSAGDVPQSDIGAAQHSRARHVNVRSPADA
jgi:hypothetical protein